MKRRQPRLTVHSKEPNGMQWVVSCYIGILYLPTVS
jgi:hypothetical protein